jgi:ADP-ribosylarginine hydrolase
MLNRFQATMILHAVGDAMGYYNGKWEFKVTILHFKFVFRTIKHKILLKFSGVDIHEELLSLGGVDKLKIEPRNWRVSDDTVLNIANAECLVNSTNNDKEEPLNDSVYIDLISYYKKGMEDMVGRAPGGTTINNVGLLVKLLKDKKYHIPFNSKGGGCGASMRSPSIALRFSKPEQKKDLIAFALESSRMTHHNPIGYLGGVAAALLTSYALQNIDINDWGAKCLEDLEIAKDYIKESGHCVEENLKYWPNFTNCWLNYLKIRKIDKIGMKPVFPQKYGVKERDEFYKTILDSKWAGAAGLDSVLIAYDALLGCNGDWIELCHRAMLHGGDNDSTGCIAGIKKRKKNLNIQIELN